MQEARVCYERLERILEVPEEQNGSMQVQDVSSITCYHAAMTHPGADKNAFSDITYTLLKGALYGITGPNGSGKSSFLKAISGLYPDNIVGDISFNDIRLNDIDRDALHKQSVGLTEQEAPILRDSLLANLTLFSDEQQVSSDLRALIDALGLQSFIDGLPDGMRCQLDERRLNVSGGEKQKIAIIRQLLQNPDVMLFDEPTSALDARSRKEFISILQDKKQSHIIILVSHDDRLLSACDEVLSM